MIFMSGNYRRTMSDIGRIIADLEAKLTQYSGDEDLANAEEWLQTHEPGQHEERLLPAGQGGEAIMLVWRAARRSSCRRPRPGIAR